MVEKGRRDSFSVHEIHPRHGIRLRLVGVPVWLPVSQEAAMTSLPIHALKLDYLGHGRVAIGPTPWRLLPPILTLADLDHMQSHRSVQECHVTDHRPGMEMTLELGVVPCVHRDPSVQRARIIRPGERLP